MANEIDRTAIAWKEGKRKTVDGLCLGLGVVDVKAWEWAECLDSFSEEPLEAQMKQGKTSVFLKVLGRDCRIDFMKSVSEEGVQVGIKHDDGFLFQDCTAHGELTAVELDDGNIGQQLIFSFKGENRLIIEKNQEDKTLQISSARV